MSRLVASQGNPPQCLGNPEMHALRRVVSLEPIRHKHAPVGEMPDRRDHLSRDEVRIVSVEPVKRDGVCSVRDLFVRSRSGQTWKLPARAGQELSLGDDLGTVVVQRVFQNLKVDISGDEPVYHDMPGGSNPALEVTRERPDGSTGKRYVFERSMGHGDRNDPLVMTYRRTVSDYISELQIVEDGKVVTAKDIEVNHPLHYGGYHFYQSSYGQDRLGEYTVLSVVSDSGLNAVYAGYAMLIAGVVWHFWGRRTLSAWKDRMSRAVQAPAEPPRAKPDTDSRETHGD